MKFTLFTRPYCAFLANFLCFSTIAVSSDYLVETPLGLIEGKKEWYDGNAVRAYLGIPYAKPPVGDLRFRKPVSYGRLDKKLQATTLPPACVQYESDPYPYKGNESDISLNCLFLNIWAPMNASEENNKTVMFWIHGGGFRIGSSASDFLNGTALAVKGDVVVVTINYRLGVEGFFYSGTEDAPGNVGIWDMVEALKWVRENIQYFGGDKNSITVFGHSSGGTATGMLCVSPVTRGLFKRVILQSGAPTKLSSKNDKSFEISQKTASAVGCADEEDSLKQNPKKVVDCLRGKDASELEMVVNNVTASSKSYYPRSGDDLFPRNTRLAIIDGDFTPVDVLIGSNSGDGATVITTPMKDVFGFFGEKDPQINYTYGSSIIKKNFKNFDDPDAVVEQYLGKVPEDDYDKIRFKVFTASGDYSKTCPSNYFAESFAKKKVSVFMYFFTHVPSVTPWAPWMLAVSHDETPFVFGYPLRYPDLYNSNELTLSKRMIKAWSSFAKTGVPDYGTWPKYSKESPLYQELNASNIIPSSQDEGPHQKNCNFFRPYFGF